MSIELRKLRAGIGYRSTSLSRSPSPVPPPRKAPVKIIRPPKEPVASTFKIEQPAVKATSQTRSQQEAKAQKSVPPNPPSNPPRRLAPARTSLPSPTVISSPPPFAPSDLYISMMSGLAMANMPQTMQAAAAADPMAAFQLAQMCFTPSPTFPLPPFSLIPPQPDPVAVQPQLHAPNLPPKPVSNSSPKSNSKATSAPVPPSAPKEENLKLVSTPAPTLTSDPSVAIEMDPLVLKQKRQARKRNIGWIPEPGFPDRGTFNLVPTLDYVHWSASGQVTQPDSQRSLVMEDLPAHCRTTKFVRSWSDQFSAIAVYFNGGGKALIEFPSREVAKRAYDSPRLRDGPYKRAMHVRVFWYRPQVGGTVSSPTVTANRSTGATEEVRSVLTDTTSNIISEVEELVSMDIDDSTPLAETAECEGIAQSKGKGLSLPPPERDLPDVNPPVRSSTAPTSTSRPGSLSIVIPFIKADQEGQRRQSSPVDLIIDISQGWSEPIPSHPPVSPLQHVSLISCTKAPPHPHSSPPETTQRERTPTGSPPSLRYPSSTPEMINHPGRVPSPSGGTSAHDTRSPTSIPETPTAGDSSLEQQLRVRLLAMKQTRIMSRGSEKSSSTSTPSTVVDPGPDTLFRVASPPPVSQTPDSIVTSESLEFLATSFIADTIQAAQGFPSDPERLDTAIQGRLSKKRGSIDAFGSSANIAFKRQRLAQQIEESKRIMERFKAAKSKEERKQIYALWEESNRFVSLNRVDCALILLCGPLFPLCLGLWSYFRNPQLRPFSGHAMRKDALLSTATMKRSQWTRLDRQSLPSSPLPFVELIFCRTCWLRDVRTLIVVSLHFYCVSTAFLATCFSSASLFLP